MKKLTHIIRLALIAAIAAPVLGACSDSDDDIFAIFGDGYVVQEFEEQLTMLDPGDNTIEYIPVFKPYIYFSTTQLIRTGTITNAWGEVIPGRVCADGTCYETDLENTVPTDKINRVNGTYIIKASNEADELVFDRITFNVPEALGRLEVLSLSYKAPSGQANGLVTATIKKTENAEKYSITVIPESADGRYLRINAPRIEVDDTGAATQVLTYSIPKNITENYKATVFVSAILYGRPGTLVLDAEHHTVRLAEDFSWTAQ